jgi:hypothetical protein
LPSTCALVITAVQSLIVHWLSGRISHRLPPHFVWYLARVPSPIQMRRLPHLASGKRDYAGASALSSFCPHWADLESEN